MDCCWLVEIFEWFLSDGGVFFAENEGLDFVSNHGSQSRNLGKYGIFAENENLTFRFPANTGGGRNLSSIKLFCGAVVFLGAWWVFLVDAVFFWGVGGEMKT